MKKALFSLLFMALSAMAFAQQWTSINKNSSTNGEPAGPKVKLISSSEKEVVVDFTLAGFELTKVNTPNGVQNIVSVPKMATCLEAGAPNLPLFPIPILIGDFAEMAVDITNGEYIDYDVEVAPSKGNISRQIDPETVPYTYGEMYGMNAFYPATQAYLEAPYIIRDFRGQNIMVTPFTYNPITKTLRVYHHLVISMRKVSDNGANPKLSRRSSIKMDPEMKQEYSRRFINFSENSTKYNYIGDRGEMLVICADQFMSGMQEFVSWKNQSGRPTTMVSVSEVGGNNDTQIKNYINNIYTDPDRNLQFVLFVGDYQDITPHPVSGERSDNWFGQLEGSDRYEEVIVGRFSVQNDAHLANHVNKVLYYERDLEKGLTWMNKGLGIGSIGAGSGHYDEDDYEHMDFIRDTLEHYTYEHVTELHGGGGGASASSISASINEGVSIINYCNHGSQTSWGVANYSNSHVNALTNDYKWPFIWSVACLCGQFNYGSECFAEAWMRATNSSTGAPTGAIAGMFSWMEQPWIPPMYGQDEMVNILTEWHNSDNYNHTFGGASAHGNMYVMDMVGSNGYSTHDTWILFGDPSLLVRTDNPTEMNVSYSPSALMYNMTELEVTAENTDYGIATLMMDGEIIASGVIENGICTLHFDPLSDVGTATLTVIGYNKITSITPIEVVPAEGPFITVEGSMPDFAPVNVETNLSMSFKNLGVDYTDGPVTVTVFCANESLNFTDYTASFDALAANETITIEDAFSFIISASVEDGSRFQIDVTIADNSHTWTGKVFVTASQAILNYTGAEWSGSFVPGEEVSILANFHNIGHYMATHAVATITCDNEYVTILNNTLDIGTIDPDGTAICPFHVAIDANCPQNEQIPITFILHADDGLMAEGSLILKNACVIIVEMRDGYGDGWNGNALKLSFDDGTPDMQLTLEDGDSGTKIIEIGNDVHVVLSWIRGYYSYECSFTMKYENGETIWSASNPSAGQLHEFDCNCSGDPVIIYNPVENLNIVIEDPNVILTWDAPEDATSYVIMRNGIEIAQTSETNYTDQTDQLIQYTYCVIAVYGEGSSVPECVSANLACIDENDSAFTIYPNPTNSTLNINGGDSEFNYVLYNGLGQVVLNGKAQGIEQINVENLTKGVYFIRLTNGTQVQMEKVIVK